MILVPILHSWDFPRKQTRVAIWNKKENIQNHPPGWLYCQFAWHISHKVSSQHVTKLLIPITQRGVDDDSLGEVWSLMILLALVGTAYSWRFRDNENYTDIIAGIVTEAMTYANQYVAWLFTVIGIIETLILFMRATEIFNQKG
jgi:hypothetical protein